MSVIIGFTINRQITKNILNANRQKYVYLSVGIYSKGY